MNEFELKNKEMIKKMGEDRALRELSIDWLLASAQYEYSYHFTWMGRPVIQYPQDVLAMQEIIWNIKPDLIIETGIAHGGSLIFYASMLELIGSGEVVGIDIDIRKHNRVEIEKHPMFKRIKMIKGSSTSKEVAEKVKEIAQGKKKIIVCLDSNHSHKHVLEELNIYSGFVTKDSYLVVFDTIVEDLPENFVKNRPWGKGDNPKTAAHEFLKTCSKFEIDYSIQNKLLITTASDGF